MASRDAHCNVAQGEEEQVRTRKNAGEGRLKVASRVQSGCAKVHLLEGSIGDRAVRPSPRGRVGSELKEALQLCRMVSWPAMSRHKTERIGGTASRMTSTNKEQ